MAASAIKASWIRSRMLTDEIRFKCVSVQALKAGIECFG